jgi:hypothetical protein
LDDDLMAPTAFYCVADERYFGGAVGLVNSLRLVGHDEPIHVLDCGLTAEQRDLLAPQVKLIPAPSDAPPWLLKTVAPLQRPADTMVLLDADIVVTRSLAPLVETARGGRLVAFTNPVDRFVPEWGELLGLGPARRGPYVSSAAICVGRELGGELIGLLSRHQAAVDFELTHWRRNVPGYAFTYADQDVLNAILATCYQPAAIAALDSRLAPTPPFSGLRLVDERSLRCAFDDGVEPYLVHHHVVKPWLEPTHHGVYSRLLRRLLLGDDVAIKVPEGHIPSHLRAGPLAWAERAGANARARFRWHVREPVARALGGRTGSRAR